MTDSGKQLELDGSDRAVDNQCAIQTIISKHTKTNSEMFNRAHMELSPVHDRIKTLGTPRLWYLTHMGRVLYIFVFNL